MSAKIIVLIDLDDTMIHLSRAWCRWLNAKHGTNVLEEDILGWKISDYFPGLTEDEVFAPIHTNEFWAGVESMRDAAAYIKLLMDEGFEVYVCTASLFDTIKSKFDCVLGRYFPFISRNQIIVTRNKRLIAGDILIDDGVHNLEGGRYHKVLMSAPHNQQYNAIENGMTRVNNWKEAYEAVHSYANGIYERGQKHESN